MVYITGDCHADWKRFSTDRFPEQKEMNRDDIMIVCGDFGLWHDTPEERYWLKWLNGKPFTTVFVDGNHECLHKDTDVLTDQGWVNIQTVYNNLEQYNVASVDLNSNRLSYSKPLAKIKSYSDSLIYFNGTDFSQCVTPGHDVVVNGKKVKAVEAMSMDLREKDLRFCIDYDTADYMIDDNILKLIVYVVMDGTIVDYSKYAKNSKKKRIQFHFKKERKVNSLREILESCGLKYTERHIADGSIFINIYSDSARTVLGYIGEKKVLPDWVRLISKRQFLILLNMILETDGTMNGNNIYWRTTSKHNLDLITELCVKYNYDINVRYLSDVSGYQSNCPQYKASIQSGKRLDHRIDIHEVSYHDDVYCLTMKDGTLITRYNNLPCITGNCFDRLYSGEFPVVDFHGGKAHKIRDHIYHLMRGEVFDFDGKKFWCFGGASSHDIQDGILDRDDFATDDDFLDEIRRWYAQDKYFRINHVSWWKQELPTNEEMEHGLQTLEANNFEVDYIISHCCPQEVASIMGYRGSDILTSYFNTVAYDTKFTQWHFGHYHDELQVYGKFILHYTDIERIL